MTQEHVRYFEVSKIPVTNKTLVLRYLENLDLLGRDAIITLMVSEELLLLGLEVRPFSPLNLIEAQVIARRAIINKSAGVILAEVYRDSRPWPSQKIETALLQQELRNCGLALIDVLVFEQKCVRSRAFPSGA
jgi:hypothetical protein